MEEISVKNKSPKEEIINLNEIQKIKPPKLTRGLAIKQGKFKKKIERLYGGINKDLLGKED